MAKSDISKITSATPTYVVCAGDTLWAIASECIAEKVPGFENLTQSDKDITAGVKRLSEVLNPDITNPDLIYVGQKIILQGTAAKKTTNKTQLVKITNFGLQSNTDRTVFATWAWDIINTDHYEYQWNYGTGDGVAFVGEHGTTTNKQSVYSGAPENADSVTFRVRPISKTYKKGEKDVHHWTSGWSTVKTYYFKNNPPEDIEAPDVSESDGYTLTAKLSNLDINATSVQFQIYNVDTGAIYKTGSASIKVGNATYSCTMQTGAKYNVRCRGVRGKIYGNWSGYSETVVGPDAGVGNITSIYALSSNEVELTWAYDEKYKIFDVEYTTVRRYFDSNPNAVTTATFGSTEAPHKVGRASINDLEPGHEYFFRLRGRRTSTISKSLVWSEIVSITVGTAPTAPTTWSSVTSVDEIGTPVTLNWMHNSLDGSRQTEATLQITLDDGTFNEYKVISGTCSTISNTTQKEVSLPTFEVGDLAKNTVIKVFMSYANSLEAPTLRINNNIGPIAITAGDNVGSCTWDANTLVVFTYDGVNWVITNNNASLTSDSYTIDTTKYNQGTIIHWAVKTAGVLKDSSGAYVYGPLSMSRTVKIYPKPALTLSLPNLVIPDDGAGEISQLVSFPLEIKMEEHSVKSIHSPIGYHISVVAQSAYETLDNIGNPKMVSEGEAIYSKYFDTATNPFEINLSAGDLNLENGISYAVVCSVSMNSGLTAEESDVFEVAWADAKFWPNAEILYDKNTYTTSICPYCKDESDNLLPGIKLSVYRREFDGSFVKLNEEELDNLNQTFITDPHPALDYARYRIVATTEATGAVTYYDIPGFPIGEPSVIIQWDDIWTNFDNTGEADLEQPAWSGSLISIPYNIDVSDDYDGEVELVKYIGRKNPVSYHGTQVGHTAQWNMEIPKKDKELLYALRRLAEWMGNAYVREPSGSGYWASIKVSISQEHLQQTIPVSISVTRVEGGV